jgi:hypothetical protein
MTSLLEQPKPSYSKPVIWRPLLSTCPGSLVGSCDGAIGLPVLKLVSSSAVELEG